MKLTLIKFIIFCSILFLTIVVVSSSMEVKPSFAQYDYEAPEYFYETPPYDYEYESPPYDFEYSYEAPEYFYETPPYDYEYESPPYDYEYQYQYEYEYEYPAPYSYEYQYQYEYETPYAYEYPIPAEPGGYFNDCDVTSGGDLICSSPESGNVINCDISGENCDYVYQYPTPSGPYDYEYPYESPYAYEYESPSYVYEYESPSAPDFSVSASPASQSVELGQSVPYDVVVTSLNGFSGDVVLSATDTFSGVTYTFTSNPVTNPPNTVTVPSNGSVLSVMTADASLTAALGTHIVRITGTSGALSDDTTVLLDVSAATFKPWIQITNGGGVIVQNNINVVAEPPTGDNLQYSALIGQRIANAPFTSAKEWLVQDYGSTDVYPPAGSEPTPIYTSLSQKYPVNCSGLTTIVSLAEIPAAGGVCKTTGDLAVSESSYPNGPAVVIVPGNLTINASIGNEFIADGTGIIFIVSGNITIASHMTRVDGVFINDGVFNSGTTGASPSNDQPLLVNGGVVGAFGDVSGALEFRRDLGSSNNETTPSEVFHYEPKYLWLFRDLIGDSKLIFRETAP